MSIAEFGYVLVDVSEVATFDSDVLVPLLDREIKDVSVGSRLEMLVEGAWFPVCDSGKVELVSDRLV